MPKNLKGVVSKDTQIAKYPNWTTLPQRPIDWIETDHRIEWEIDNSGVGRVRVRQGYNATLDDVRYGYGSNQ